MSQLSFADSEFVQKRRATRKERFLAKMEKLVPWHRLISVIESFIPSGTLAWPPSIPIGGDDSNSLSSAVVQSV